MVLNPQDIEKEKTRPWDVGITLGFTRFKNQFGNDSLVSFYLKRERRSTWQPKHFHDHALFGLGEHEKVTDVEWTRHTYEILQHVLPPSLS